MKTSDKTFDVSDVADGYALAYEQVADLAAMIGAMTEGLIQDSLEFSKAQEDSYKC